MLSAVPETAEPFPLVLEDTLAREAVLTHDRIQAGLGGDGLPPTIVKGDALIGDLSDQIAMEADLSDVPVHGDAGVLEGPVTTLGDRGVHEAFDLAHVLRLVDVLSIDPSAGICGQSSQLVGCHTVQDGCGLEELSGRALKDQEEAQGEGDLTNGEATHDQAAAMVFWAMVSRTGRQLSLGSRVMWFWRQLWLTHSPLLTLPLYQINPRMARRLTLV